MSEYKTGDICTLTDDSGSYRVMVLKNCSGSTNEIYDLRVLKVYDGTRNPHRVGQVIHMERIREQSWLFGWEISPVMEPTP